MRKNGAAPLCGVCRLALSLASAGLSSRYRAREAGAI